MESFYQEIIGYWKQNNKRIPWNIDEFSVWTHWVKETFCALADGKEVNVELSKTGKHGKGEYLVDVCWWKEERRKYWLELVLESEWIDTEEEIDGDFFKLIDLKAVHKIWVCSYGSRIYPRRKEKLIESVRSAKFTIPEEKYLILNLPDSIRRSEKNRLTIHAFWMSAQGKVFNLADDVIIKDF